MGRRVARDELFKILFEADSNKLDPSEVFESYIKRDEIEKKTIDDSDKKFMKDYCYDMVEKKEIIDKTIQDNMKGWQLDRIGIVERELLRFATYEILEANVPFEIVINEVVELAKLYGEAKTYEFINGVLANVLKNK